MAIIVKVEWAIDGSGSNGGVISCGDGYGQLWQSWSVGTWSVKAGSEKAVVAINGWVRCVAVRSGCGSKGSLGNVCDDSDTEC